jgi:hypothetical protein
MMRSNLRLFATAFLQVYFVAIQTVFLANSFYIGVAIFGFLISFVWTFNVQKVVFGNITQKLIYSAGAMIGSVLGLLTTKIIL